MMTVTESFQLFDKMVQTYQILYLDTKIIFILIYFLNRNMNSLEYKYEYYIYVKR
jgi:hypothetical protein